MTLVTDTATAYQVRPRHRNEEVREQVPADYAGVMISDRGRSYEASEPAGIEQQKCLRPVLRSISEVLEKKVGAARRFGLKLKALLERAMTLWHERRAGPAVADFEKKAEEVRSAASRHLRDRSSSDVEDQRLLNGLGRWHDSGSLLLFLGDSSIEPTNNAAERALRPAVIARKVSHCTKTARGTGAFEAWTSVLVTLARTVSGVGLLGAIVALVRPTRLPPA